MGDRQEFRVGPESYRLAIPHEKGKMAYLSNREGASLIVYIFVLILVNVNCIGRLGWLLINFKPIYVRFG